MKIIKLITLVTMLGFSISTAYAKGPSENASAASKHSVLAGSHGLKASGQIASGVVAIPLLAVGSVGAMSMNAGTALIEVATDTAKPLEISDKTITADRSPAEEMNIKKTNLDRL